jgi:hypothetical protein
MSIPTNNTTTGSSGANITFSDMNAGPATLVLAGPNGVSTTIAADGRGNLKLGGTVDGSLYKNYTFSKVDLDEKIKQFHAGKYTRKYMEVYLDFMVMNAMLDNLEFLEYKVALDKELLQ